MAFKSLLLCGLLGLSQGLFNVEVVMRSGDRVNEMDEGDFPTYHGGRCTVRFSRDGNLATQNGFLTGGWDANQNSQCAYGANAMTYALQRDGNFVAYCGYYLDYSTHTGQGQGAGDYFLAIDTDCILHLYKGTLDCNYVNVQEEIWTNIRLEPLQNGDRLRKGEIVRQEGTSLIMQSSDGNLVLYNGESIGEVLWAANEEWVSPPGSNIRDFYARVTKNGRLLLVGIDYQYGDESVYFSKKLKNFNGANCFTVEYDANEDDLVAVPCVANTKNASFTVKFSQE
jgi:hypothetical protein